MTTVAEKHTFLEGISQLLLHSKLVEPTELLHYQNQARARQQSLPLYLVSNALFAGAQLAQLIAQHVNLPKINLDRLEPSSEAKALLSQELIQAHQTLPLYVQDGFLFIATDDPFQQEAFKEIQVYTGLPTKVLIAEADKLDKHLQILRHKKIAQSLDNYLLKAKENKGGATSSEDDPTVKLVNQILYEAIEKKASDIHFEPLEQEYRLRYRQDGLLNLITTIPYPLANRISTRLKVMANLDIAERRLPQDGSFHLQIAYKRVDFRLSTCPTVYGEKLVIRILDTELMNLDVDKLGLDDLQKNHFLRALTKPQGLILVTGPTGSGKTVSLYTALKILNTVERNIFTAEDPIEIKISGLNQVNINRKAGLTFAKLLRSFLRQDPDIMMVGEIRDLETAEIAIKASQTGHLVLSTLHTNNAVETLNRLTNLGIPSFNLASSISLLVAQRLARRLCEHCKLEEPKPPAASLIELGFRPEGLAQLKLYKPQGCQHCTKGYYGRLGLFEVMPMSKKLAELIMSACNPQQLFAQAQEEGMLSLYQSGLEKVRQGLTTIEEINRVTVD